jgi:hypothetical protein
MNHAAMNDDNIHYHNGQSTPPGKPWQMSTPAREAVAFPIRRHEQWLMQFSNASTHKKAVVLQI